MFNTGLLSWPLILKNLPGRLVQGDLNSQARGVSTDSRNIQKGNLFVALAGPHFDGRAFLSQAFVRGAAGALISGPWSLDSIPASGIVVEVDDTLQALGDLARNWRQTFSLPLVGITGSNGQTTTKEILAGILESIGPT
ncbi:MAG TPA: Mur ligase domain-containing protein, partial [Thermodesulfobacteriota bacterium]|nr:Mur ligase domain-containing protein [Thermodesulfobacteriota bacterium]